MRSTATRQNIPRSLLRGSSINNKMKHRKTTATLFDISISCRSFPDIMKTMQEKIDCKKKGYISITNTESVYHATKIDAHKDYINKADFSCCDGVGVALIGKMLGYRIPRLHGPDLMLRCCEYGLEHRWRHYFYGGSQGVPELVSRRLTQRFPGLITAGCYSPEFRPIASPEKKKVLDRINASKPDILWVGLGLLKQESWIEGHFDKIEAPWMIGVGAAFDFHAGRIRRAPAVFQKAGLEWLYRLVFEPRMLIRNVYSFKLLFDTFFKRNERK